MTKSKLPQLDPLDSRLNAWRPEIADITLKGKVDAQNYVEGFQARITVAFTDMRPQPGRKSAIDTQLLYGETVRVFEVRDGWLWVQSETDGYVGWIEEEVGPGLDDQLAALFDDDFSGDAIRSLGRREAKAARNRRVQSDDRITALDCHFHRVDGTEGEIDRLDLKPVDSRLEVDKQIPVRLPGDMSGGRSVHEDLVCSTAGSAAGKLEA